jgi:regulator of extracellular matrix RemA (YlzA/DUF370 family)
MVSAHKVVGIVKPNSIYIRNIVRDAREKNRLVSAAAGKRVRSVVLTADGYVFLSTITSEVLASRLSSDRLERESTT